ncbi:MAG: histidine kinase N-terminal 7TM domain-containing protein [Anaerolineales bacterium]
MINIVLNSFLILNQLLTAGIAITAFSLLIYAFTFNLRDRVARSFAIILICVVIVFVGDTIATIAATPTEMAFWLRLQWVGIIFLPSAYLQFSDALLATTGRPSRGRRRFLVRITYLISLSFLVALVYSALVGPLVQNIDPAPHLERTALTWIFTGYYGAIMVLAWINFYRSHQRTVTSSSRRRMQYLLAGSLAPALGSYPYLLFGSSLAIQHPIIFWILATVSNILVYFLLVLMAYSVAFFGVPWPDRVVKRRLFKWLMRGPVTAVLVLALTVIVRETGQFFGWNYAPVVPIGMVAGILIFQHLITLVAPLWERWLFHGGDQENIYLLQTLEERLLTSGDLRQFLESVLAAMCDSLQVTRAFAVVLNPNGIEMIVSIGSEDFSEEELPEELLQVVNQNGSDQGLFAWGNYWLVPLFDEQPDKNHLLGLIGVLRSENQVLDKERNEALLLLSERATLALEDRHKQQQVFSSLQTLTPQMDMVQRLRAAARYDGSPLLTVPQETLEYKTLSRWVKDALGHYWGGPKLTQSPLLNLHIVQKAMEDHERNPANALRDILTKAIEKTRPDGERRFTGEWLLYNILEMKFMEGRKVRDIARRLAMSEADLYRKQRVAIETVAAAILEMEQTAREEENEKFVVELDYQSEIRT